MKQDSMNMGVTLSEESALAHGSTVHVVSEPLAHNNLAPKTTWATSKKQKTLKVNQLKRKSKSKPRILFQNAPLILF